MDCQQRKSGPAALPFTKENANIILQTADGVDSYSPFNAAQVDSGTNFPILHVSQTSEALDRLLRLCHPLRIVFYVMLEKARKNTRWML
ncbi:uncharacterized protein LAESUDRAFT_733107 [Laetiporus sulphureus 93-53]|uniref:Uncharacterized protein n=1 Tax=Laetiporus sulphureus 93-53 TaxID=1314785 RepID=A0A165AQU4_9APHY|nr:uncharacterized protein LAESUDRAFT_733107 [Laetiporus sulphureus 93-53]KZS99475.1 hypothetical protein LAESUDRAFT_733107 [Laetiporus sulphureus 93-53]